MNGLATRIEFPPNRLRIWALAAAMACSTTTGCWQEIRYNPIDEPIDSPSQPVVLREENPPEQSPPPSAEQLFVDEKPAAPAEQQPEEESMWVGLESELPAATPNKPAPPAEIEWLDETSENGQREIVANPTRTDPRTALAAWRVGSKWSLAVGVYGIGKQSDRYGDIWKQADSAAQSLGIQLPPLPEYVAQEDLLSAATDSLLGDSSVQLTDAVSNEHSDMHRALCDLAIKTHALLLIYSPDNSDLETLLAEIRQAAEDSALPERLWQPVLESLEEIADFQDVKRAVFELHDKATDYLTEQVGP